MLPQSAVVAVDLRESELRVLRKTSRSLDNPLGQPFANASRRKWVRRRKAPGWIGRPQVWDVRYPILGGQRCFGNDRDPFGGVDLKSPRKPEQGHDLSWWSAIPWGHGKERRAVGEREPAALNAA